MSHEAKIDFEKVSREIVADHNDYKMFAIKPDCHIKSTRSYMTLDKYSWFPGDPDCKWLHYWKGKRNAHFERFGLVPPEIEIFILGKTLSEYFEDTECENSKKNSLPNSR